ncbi:DUF3515 family protein [Gryllotalpicola protaetiae]|uniref:DUF3515 family protein n=1 Tax=Gryllotalpicola protaetiae TaxID=2419771 RepID=A0A387BMA8_9MICO|nr:DUF3515 family protein [Gryllotalpicola protaetiae]AYG02166.1 DUF3515 family protein [Gryllotalpicola protaetiae]
MSRLRVAAAAVAAIAFAALLAGCTPTVALNAAPHANNPKCASVTVILPDTVAGQAKDYTNAQATSAWGSPVKVQLRCGVTPLGPTTKPCITVGSGQDAVDWVLTNDPDDKVLTYVTFGRSPAVEVTIQHGKGGVSDANVLPDLGQAVSQLPRTNLKCIAADDAP